MKKVTFAMMVLFVFFAVSNEALATTNTKYETALHYYYSGKYQDAVKLFKDYVNEKPDSSAYYYIGYALYKIRKYSEANEYFKKAYLIDPVFSPTQLMFFQKYPKSNKEIKKQQRKKGASTVPSAVESKEKQLKGADINKQNRPKEIFFMTLLYIIASEKHGQ